MQFQLSLSNKMTAKLLLGPIRRLGVFHRLTQSFTILLLSLLYKSPLLVVSWCIDSTIIEYFKGVQSRVPPPARHQPWAYQVFSLKGDISISRPSIRYSVIVWSLLFWRKNILSGRHPDSGGPAAHPGDTEFWRQLKTESHIQTPIFHQTFNEDA